VNGEYCTKGQNQYPNNSYLSCIGNVTGFEDGAVEVRWATGFATKVCSCPNCLSLYVCTQ